MATERLFRPAAVLQFLLDNSLLLVVGALAGLAWANAAPASYERVSHLLAFGVNDIGMVFFFGLMTKEVYEATLPGGPLASRREAAVPIFAAAGGMVVPALVYVSVVVWLGRSDLVRGWAIPCATDIAFAYLAARMIFKAGHPATPFLLLLAIADDAFGLIILALAYPQKELAPATLFVGVAIAVALAVALRRRRVANFWIYVLGPGALAWAAMYFGGLHPALALVPIVPAMPHPKSESSSGAVTPSTMHHFEAWWRIPVQVVLLVFGFVNAGVSFSSVGTVTFVVLASLIVGKPAGIVLATWLAERFGFRRPSGLDYRDLVTLGTAAGIGFTVALFFATASFPAGIVLSEAKMGALLSVIALPIAIAVGKILRNPEP